MQELKTIEKYHDNGVMRYKSFYITNLKSGINILHNPNGPAVKHWYDNGQIDRISYYINNIQNNESGPAIQEFYKNGQLARQEYWLNGLLNNIYGPSIQVWNWNGQIQNENYYLNGFRYSSLEEWQQAVKINCLK